MLLSAADEPLGTLLQLGSTAANTFIASLKRIMTISIENGENSIGSETNTYFTGQNCTENALKPSNPFYPYFIVTFRTDDGTPHHYIASPEIQSTRILSYRSSNAPYTCGTMDEIREGFPLTEVSLPFAYPVAPPVKFE